MNLRLACKEDLPQLKAVYKKIIENMDRNNIRIWDDVYPCEFFGDDMEHNRLYVLTDGDEIISAFALCESNSGEGCVNWINGNDKALYIDRFGVNVNYLRQGIGSAALCQAAAAARELGAGSLRLFVVDINEPAVRLYEKNGFERADGIYDERIDEDLVLHEFGFEKKLSL